METIGNLNGKEVIYIKYDFKFPWFKYFPCEKWLLFAIAEKDDINILSEINRQAIDHNVVYVCSVGNKCELFHDMFDEDMVIRDAENEYLPQHLIMTTWHYEFDEGLWFALYTAVGDGLNINKVICLDISNTDFRPQLQEVIRKIETGWLPSYS
jgi:hypothetical protein